MRAALRSFPSSSRLASAASSGFAGSNFGLASSGNQCPWCFAGRVFALSAWLPELGNIGDTRDQSGSRSTVADFSSTSARL
jgi:hypothetical protein